MVTALHAVKNEIAAMNANPITISLQMPLAYFGIDYLAVVIISWIAFAVAFGALTLWFIRLTISSGAHWYEWGLLGALIGAVASPFLFPRL